MCCGTGCQASNSPRVAEALKSALASEGLADSVELRLTGCHGCEQDRSWPSTRQHPVLPSRRESEIANKTIAPAK
jgi:hypothetical protein